jgi:acyl-CoA synthetase (AMP-forming)/AMP-acid ligase II
VLDTTGNLSLLGRLTEFVNVAGEKVSPYEVEAILDQHRDVLQCVSFPVPDPLRGERVYALAVLRPDAQGRVDSAALRSFVRERLAPHKVPEKILLVDQLPIGPTGKLQRRRLAEQLGLVDRTVGERS